MCSLLPALVFPEYTITCTTSMRPVSPHFASPVVAESFSLRWSAIFLGTVGPKVPGYSCVTVYNFATKVESWILSAVSLLGYRATSTTPSEISPCSTWTLSDAYYKVWFDVKSDPAAVNTPIFLVFSADLLVVLRSSVSYCFSSGLQWVVAFYLSFELAHCCFALGVSFFVVPCSRKFS